jgi:peptidoglycan/xylan/chitin deacetylase (PgdA/CDA1 family)
MYHRVIADEASAGDIEPGMFVRASTFDMHLSALSELFELLPLRDATPASRGRIRASLTFDDGWRDNLEIAWPLMARRGIGGTIFLVRDWTAASDGDGGRFLSVDEVRQLSREGIEFGAHTATHPRLTTLSDAEVETEMRLSREAVSDWTGERCRSFAYPFGDWNARVSGMAARLFDMSVVVGGGWWTSRDSKAEIPRVSIHDDMTSTRAMLEERLVASLGRSR